jgi:hypothetical protein
MSDDNLWSTLLVPLILTQLLTFMKTFYDNYKLNKRDELRLKYDVRIKQIEHQLEKFYWPVYMYLILIYQMDYNIPYKENVHENVHENVLNRNDSSSSSNDSDTDIKTNRCLGFYMKESAYYFKCNNKIPINSVANICKSCRWKKCYDQEDLKLDIEHENETELEYTPLSYRKRKTTRRHNYDVELGQHEIEKKLEDMKFLHVVIDPGTVNIINDKINQFYTELYTIITNGISIARPNKQLKMRLVRLLKYIKIREVMNETPKKDYSETHFGIKDNTNKVLKIIEKKVMTLNNEYRELINEGPYKSI